MKTENRPFSAGGKRVEPHYPCFSREKDRRRYLFGRAITRLVGGRGISSFPTEEGGRQQFCRKASEGKSKERTPILGEGRGGLQPTSGRGRGTLKGERYLLESKVQPEKKRERLDASPSAAPTRCESIRSMDNSLKGRPASTSGGSSDSFGLS